MSRRRCRWAWGVLVLCFGCGDDASDGAGGSPSGGQGGQGAAGGSGTGGSLPECEVAADCAALNQGCQVGVCAAGTCTSAVLPAGASCGDVAATECSQGDTCDAQGNCLPNHLPEATPCGSPGDACSLADSCDGEGSCVVNHLPDGLPCDTCALGLCSCEAGACVECPAFATVNEFTTARSIEGWTLTGGWGLYREAPQVGETRSTPFPTQVLGSDGNRVAPYPGIETETSFARTPPGVLPAALQFLSWNEDEGAGADNKTIRVSVDGGLTFTTLVDCANDTSLPFCQARLDRPVDDWDAISIPVPAQLVGSVGIVELGYATGDACCAFEKGWFVDATNFGTECACLADEACDGFGSSCGASVCGPSGACVIDPVAAGTACGPAEVGECSDADVCDGAGYCDEAHEPNGLTCGDCPAGFGACSTCLEGTCASCTSLPGVENFGSNQSIESWTIEDLSPGQSGADWRLFAGAPPNQINGSTATPLSIAPAFGTDGNRQAPYPGLEHEHSRVTSPPDVVPAALTFLSWNVDEGSTDNKIIEISVDGGSTWITLVNCSSGIGTPRPFCEFRDEARSGTDWDPISIDTSAYQGQVGQIRITYDTQDACCDFERGWFIDWLAFAQVCLDVTP